MRTFLTLWRKELGSYFLSPIAYVTIIFFLVVMGFSFWILASVLVSGPVGIGFRGSVNSSLSDHSRCLRFRLRLCHGRTNG